MRTEVSETTSYRFHEDICSLLRSVRCCTSLEDCSGASAAESYPASVPGELGLDSLPLVAHPITVILVKANTRSAATKRLRKRIQLVSPVLVCCNEQVVDAAVEVWASKIGIVCGAVRGYAAYISETSGIAVFVEPRSTGRTTAEIATSNMVELVKAIPTSLTRAPAGPHALASAEVRWIAENTDVETSTSARDHQPRLQQYPRKCCHYRW